MRNKNRASILLFDIETMANLGWVWGKWEQDVIAFKKPWYMLSFAYKWLGERGVKAYALPDFRGYKKDRANDKLLCEKLWELFDEADIILAHNGDAFDIKKANMRFLKHGFLPPSPYKQLDTKKIAKRYFKFDSNSLNELAKNLGIGRKIPHEGWDLWFGCAERDDPKSWAKMVKYNKHDVLLLEAVYLKMRAWVNNHPNLNVFNETVEQCPNCGGNLFRRGFAVSRVRRYQRFQCNKCGAWSQKPVTGVVR